MNFRIFGFNVTADWMALVLPAIILFSMQNVIGLVIALAIMPSVLLHELGHAMAGRHFKRDVGTISLSLFGGGAPITGVDASRRKVLPIIGIALAGPAVSAILAGLFAGVGLLTGLDPLFYIGILNFALMCFNLLPIYPMDGGRVVHAVLVGLARKIYPRVHGQRKDQVLRSPKVLTAIIGAVAAASYVGYSTLNNGFSLWTFAIMFFVLSSLHSWFVSRDDDRVTP